MVLTYLEPRVGYLDLEHIDRDKVFLVRAALSADPKLSPKTVNHVLATLKTVLSDAVINGYLDSNPSLLVKQVPLPDEELDFLRAWELRQLLGKVALLPAAVVMTAALAGLREGEVFGLMWDCLDFVGHSIYVKRQYNRNGWGPPKTKSSRRRVDLVPVLEEALRQLPSRFKGELVFPSTVDTPLHAGNFMRRVFRPALRRTKLRGVSFHSLRHTYASMLIEAGAHPKYIQRQMGHASIKMTMDLYGHLRMCF
jgi:integrase